mmetsp:Transcript_3775/g.9898  ORF Transcript_3775/g.9898 Transcript_3775/m.9898 type:complete len:733 (+) Transcript_3775:123-2321(+)|eukprot:CAMPEP_0197194970 /NCGR_PEP_ID=MMETSP1423-20130617/30231_1 /TAXON_ID=476441 /ORGANISM="Pseudo-nitzschia heimii, Strain UNC1101" /LENGTH=732 /DNA_ID=CAMNT_0042648493 /DNA_START=69 /DNA_END=2267 /DNA_ORIENTATION=-
MKNHKHREALLSSYWKKFGVDSESTSSPAVVNTEDSNVATAADKETFNDRNAIDDKSNESWAETLHCLAQKTVSISSPSSNDANTVDLNSKSYSPRRTPVLTMTLIKLHDVFESFCSHLTDATHINVQAACLVLESGSIDAASKTSGSKSSDTIGDSPSSPRSPSPSRSPITSWFIGSYNSATGYSENSEWEKFSNPLIIFAGLEAIYSACLHLESHNQALTLVRLYRKTIDDLRSIRKVLCDPLVYATEEQSIPGTNLISSHREKATTLTFSLEAIMSLCECRCKLIEQQTRLCSSEIVDIEKIIVSFQMISSNIPKKEAQAEHLVRSISREVDGWSSILKTYFSIQNFRFMNAIVGCQKTKLNLKFSSNTLIYKWMCNVYKSFVSMLPFYFESISSDAVSRYGFQQSQFRAKNWNETSGPGLDLEAKLDDYLRTEGRSGIPLAIGVVADVSVVHMLRLKSNHGSFIGKQQSLNSRQGRLDPDDILSAYPAVYMRITTQYNSTGRMFPRNSVKQENGNDALMDESPTTGVDSRVDTNHWPYTSWNNMVKKKFKNTLSSNAEEEYLKIQWSQIDPHTSVFASSICNAMWFVAMKKTNDDNRLNRRNDEERSRKERQFFSYFITSLQLKDVFKRNLKTNDNDIGSLLHELSNTLVRDRLLTNHDANGLLESFKRIFGLRSWGDKHRMKFRTWSTNTFHEHRTGVSSWVSISSSHFNFFLGKNLMASLSGENFE